MSLTLSKLFKDPALFSDSIASVHGVVSEVLVKKETLQLLRIIKEPFPILQIEHFVVTSLTIAC